MSSHFIPFKTQQIIWVIFLGLTFTASGLGQSQTNKVPSTLVKSSESANVRGRMVYSVQFPGGSAMNFFNFLRTNGFAGDNILFAGGAANIYVPPFEVNHVRLKDIGKSLELVSEGKLEVEVVEKGEESDENIWRVRASEHAAATRTKACAMPWLFRTSGPTFRKPDATKRIEEVVNAAKGMVGSFLDSDGRRQERANTMTIETESIVIVVGSDAYVEAISSALEALENAAANGVNRAK
jgi:hypothetical protein